MTNGLWNSGERSDFKYMGHGQVATQGQEGRKEGEREERDRKNKLNHIIYKNKK